MKFFIAGLSPEQKVTLRESGVRFEDGTLRNGTSGTVFPDVDNARQAIGALRCSILDEHYDRDSSGQEIKRLDVEFEGRRVVVDRFDGQNQRAWVTATKELLSPVVKRNIWINVPHYRAFSLNKIPDGEFAILVWSTPLEVGERPSRTPATMWGIDVDCRETPFNPSGQGEAICDDAGWPVAELFENAIYIHHDLCHFGTEEEMRIYKKILEKAIVLMSLPLEERLARRQKAAEERKGAFRRAYIAQCAARFTKLVENTKKSITDGEAKIKRLQQELVVAIRECQGAVRKLEQLKTADKGQDEAYGKEFDKLHTIPKIRFIEAGDGMIKVFTDVLFCVDTRTNIKHEIGAFRIDLYVGGENNCVRWHNLTRTVDKFNAPHVNHEGNACYGNSAEVFAELVGNYEFAAAAMVAIQFVESANVDDGWGSRIRYWPVASVPAAPAVAA